MSKLNSHEVDFTKEDQIAINSFSRLNMHHQDKSKQIYQKKEAISQQEDAVTELELQDDDEIVRMKYGDCFFHVTAEHSKNSIDKQVSRNKQDVAELDQNLHDIQKKMQKLKAVLYAKFGNSINLEEE